MCNDPVYLSFSYDLPQYGSRRKLISPTGMYDEYGEVIMEDDGSYYYSPNESEGEVLHFNYSCFLSLTQYNMQYFSIKSVLYLEQGWAIPVLESSGFSFMQSFAPSITGNYRQVCLIVDEAKLCRTAAHESCEVTKMMGDLNC